MFYCCGGVLLQYISSHALCHYNDGYCYRCMIFKSSCVDLFFSDVVNLLHVTLFTVWHRTTCLLCATLYPDSRDARTFALRIADSSIFFILFFLFHCFPLLFSETDTHSTPQSDFPVLISTSHALHCRHVVFEP